MPTTNGADDMPSPPPPTDRRGRPQELRRIKVEGVCVPFPEDEAVRINRALASFPKPRRGKGVPKSA
jgi:hypothetical protein